MLSTFIVYACPVGELADQLDVYFQKTLEVCGKNPAHDYMPHCSLTGFFKDTDASIELYVEGLGRALENNKPVPSPVMAVTKMHLGQRTHSLKLNSDWLTSLISEFVAKAEFSTREGILSPKQSLHLSLAYGFEPIHRQTLERLALDVIDPNAPVRWDLRLYQRYPNKTWACHRSWSL